MLISGHPRALAVGQQCHGFAITEQSQRRNRNIVFGHEQIACQKSKCSSEESWRPLHDTRIAQSWNEQFHNPNNGYTNVDRIHTQDPHWR